MRHFIVVLGAGIILLSSATAGADNVPIGADETPPYRECAASAPDDLDSPLAALGWGVAATGIGWGAALTRPDVSVPGRIPIALTGIVLGPSFGDFYNGDTRRGLLHTGIRAGGLVMAFVAYGPPGRLCPAEPGNCGEPSTAARVVGYAGLGLFFADTIYNILSAPVITHLRNREKRPSRIVVAPTVIDRAGASSSLGLAVAGQF